jgi:SNF2 family DNA or RNA helicase
MAARCRHRLCLSGTPVENDLDELWSLFEVLMPGFLGTPDQFRMLFRHPIEKLGSQARLEALRERVAPYILRRMKEDVAPELPPKTEIVRPVALGGAQRELYESIRVAAHADVRTAIRKKGLAGSTIAILDALMKLRQVCCDPRLVRVPSARLVRDSAKYDLYFELLRTQLDQGRRVLVFSQFTSMLGLLSQGMRERGIDHVTLTGATANRQKVVDTFQEGDVGVFLISLKAGGTGLNLTRADTVIHYDPWWNPAAQAQATDRAYRIGQTRPVFVYSLIAAGSVEERMLALQQRKRHLADTILGQGSGGSLDPGELDALFAPLADE